MSFSVCGRFVSRHARHFNHCSSAIRFSPGSPRSPDVKATLTRGPMYGEVGTDFCLLGNVKQPRQPRESLL